MGYTVRLSRSGQSLPRREQPRRSNFASSSWDDPSLYVLGLVVGAIPVVAILLRGGAWGAEPTAGLLLFWFSGRALLRCAIGTFSAPHRRHPAEESGSAPWRSS